MTAALALVVSVACNKAGEDEIDRTPVSIEMSFQKDGADIDVLNLNSMSHLTSVDVKLNNENLYWNIVSDSDWCTVVAGTHRGSGSFSINVQSNQSFDSREPATLTFKAGEYTGLSLRVTQDGNVFLLSSTYSLQSSVAEDMEFTLSVPTGTEWDVLPSDWASVTKGMSVDNGSLVTTSLTLKCDQNLGASRYGTIGFAHKGETVSSADLTIFQFGNEYSYDAEGKLLLAGDADQKVSFKAPTNVISSLELPSYASYEVVDNGDGTATYTITLEANSSDCMEVRNVDFVAKMNVGSDDLKVKAIRQNYTAVDGISTAEGLARLASAVNAGEDYSQWVKNGKISLLSNIDMSSYKGTWKSIGNAAHPFSATFDGKYRKIFGLSASEPVFGVCKDATITSLVIDESCAFTAPAEASDSLLIAAVAAKLIDSKVVECVNNAAITVGSSLGGEVSKAYISGVVAKADAGSSVEKCENAGAINVTGLFSSEPRACTLYLGGLVAYNEGAIKEGANSGKITCAGTAVTQYCGGVAGANLGSIEGASNSAAVLNSALRTVNSVEDASRYIHLAGIAGFSSGDITKASNSGAVSNSSNAKECNTGGIIAYCKGGTLAGNVNTGDITAKGTAAGTGARYASVGGLYGKVRANMTLDFSDGSSYSKCTIVASNLENSTYLTQLYVGGFIGSIDQCTATIKGAVSENTISLPFNTGVHQLGYAGIGGVLGGSIPQVADGYTLPDVTLTDCSNKGEITLAATTSYAVGLRISGIGGVVGYIHGNASISGCSNSAAVQNPAQGAKSNGYSLGLGGIVGRIDGGKGKVSGCTNSGGLRGWLYNNNAYDAALTNESYPYMINCLTCNALGGIVGAYNTYMNTASTETLTIENCENSGYVYSYRGCAGGIVGSIHVGTVTACSNTGSLGQGNRSYVGGLAGYARDAQFSGSSSVCDVSGTSSGSAYYSSGGLVGIAQGGSSFTSCSFYGNVKMTSTTTANGTETYGALAGTAAAGCSFSNNKIGGAFSGLPAVYEGTMSADAHLVGSGSPSVSGTTLWDGK